MNLKRRKNVVQIKTFLICTIIFILCLACAWYPGSWTGRKALQRQFDQSLADINAEYEVREREYQQRVDELERTHQIIESRITGIKSRQSTALENISRSVNRDKRIILLFDAIEESIERLDRLLESRTQRPIDYAIK